MMQRTHVTAWQAQAPWPKHSQIEQDLRLSRGLAAIFEDDVLREHWRCVAVRYCTKPTWRLRRTGSLLSAGVPEYPLRVSRAGLDL